MKHDRTGHPMTRPARPDYMREYQAARRAAISRLIDEHRDRWEQILAEERARAHPPG